MQNFLKTANRVHFIGIGGSGMYPLAQILNSKGFILTGSDNNETDTLEAVRKMGVTVFLGHNPDNINNADLIIRSAAIPDTNPEIIRARELNIPVRERSELLGLISSWYNKAVCVSGTHGKTTASSMLVHILKNSENPELSNFSAVIGGKVKALNNGSGVAGDGEVLICEACEFADTFLKLEPNISVILNIDEDHLDYFKTMDNLIASFTKFCNNTSDFIIVNGDDANALLAVKNGDFKGEIIRFGFSKSNDYYPLNISFSQTGAEFDLMERGDFITRIALKVCGEHNILNALASCATALTLGASKNALSAGLSEFTGAGRRFEKLAVVNDITIADDYAHHPAEITAVLKSAKTMGYKRIIAVHQPFTYSRTYKLLDGFAEALSLADEVVLTEIMGGREENDYNIFSKDLAEKLANYEKNCKVFQTFEEVSSYVSATSKAGDLAVTMGCGDINKAAHMIVEKLKEIYRD